MVRRIPAPAFFVSVALLAAAQAPAAPFDGNWTTTMGCEASTRMPAYK